jgi:hypothetical protein
VNRITSSFFPPQYAGRELGSPASPIFNQRSNMQAETESTETESNIKVKTGDRVEWVKVSKRGRTIEFVVVRGTAVEVRDGYVIIMGKNGRRRRIALSKITAINEVPVVSPDQSEDEDERQDNS